MQRRSFVACQSKCQIEQGMNNDWNLRPENPTGNTSISSGVVSGDVESPVASEAPVVADDLLASEEESAVTTGVEAESIVTPPASIQPDSTLPENTSQIKVKLGDTVNGPAFWEPFSVNAEPLANGHCVIVGQSGSGKTYTITNVMAPQIAQSGTRLFMLGIQ